MCPLTTRLWCTGLLLPPILITLIPIRATFQGQLWRGARELRWVPLLGGLGAAPGAIAIGTAEMSTSTTIIISIVTIISTATSAARDKVIGSTIRNTAETLPMGTGKQRTSSGAKVRVALVESEDPVDPAVQESPAVPVAAELALEAVPVAVELEHVQGEAELELVRAAVPLRTKSVITPHHRGLVPLLGAEDLAAEVETTHEPAVAEAVIAWEVAE